MVDKMDVKQAGRVELVREIAVIGFHLRVERHVVEHAVGRQTNADLVLADRRDRRIDDLKHKAHAVLDRAAVAVGALVRIWADELLEQIAVGPMQLDAVESRRHGVFRRLRKLRDGALDVCFRHRRRRGMRLQSLGIGEHLPCGGDRRGPQYFGARRQIKRMPNAAGVHQLQDHLGALRVNRSGDLLPAGDLCLGKNPGDARVTQSVGRGRCAFGDDQARGRALLVILHHQIVRNIAGGPTARQWAHHQVILQRERSERGLGKQQRHEWSPREINDFRN